MKIEKEVYETRESWLQGGLKELAPVFANSELTLPEKIRAAIGFTSSGRRGPASECWNSKHSDDGHYEIYISPGEALGEKVLESLAHELLHTVLADGTGHGKEFRKAALKLGFDGPSMRNPVAGSLLRDRLAEIAARLGPLPHAPLNFRHGRTNGGDEDDSPDAPPKQSTRLLKSQCATCGYTCRITRKWVTEVGAPHCPLHGEMAVEGLENEEEEHGGAEGEGEIDGPQLNAMTSSD